MTVTQWSPKRSLWRTACIASLLAAHGAIAGVRCLEQVGAWPYGPADAVAVSGAYALFGTGATLTVADVSVPANPQVVARLPLRGPIKDVAVVDARAYVAAGEAGLHIVDISDPDAPVLLGSSPPLAVEPMRVEALDVAVVGNLAFVAAGFGGLLVVDVADPTEPVVVGSLTYPAGTSPLARGVAAAGDTVFLADKNYGGGLRVVDVSEPTQPVEIALVENDARDVAVRGQHVVTAEYADGLRIYDVSDPAVPTEVGFFEPPGFVVGVELAGDVAYVLRDGSSLHTGLTLVDLSDPSAPAELGSVATEQRPANVAVSAPTAFVATSEDGLHVIDVSSPGSPTDIAHLPTPMVGSTIAVRGQLAFVSYSPGDGAATGLGVFDVADPAAPSLLGFLPLVEAPREIEVADDRAYVALAASGLVIVDVATPGAPSLLGAWAGSSVHHLAVGEGYAFLIGGNFWVLDVSDPTSPHSVAWIGDPPFLLTRALALGCGHAYVVDQGEDPFPPKLVTVDVTEPESPVVTDILVDHYYPELVVAGRWGFTAAGGETLCVLDLAEPATPAELDCFDDPGFRLTDHVTHAGGVVYLTDYYKRFAAYDVSSPLDPRAIGGFAPYGSTAGVATTGELVYATTGDAGFYVLRGCSIFFDGFESGDTSAWLASTAPDPK